MTHQEVLWKDLSVLIVSIMAQSGVIHWKHRRLIGRVGTVVKEAKNGMLLVRFEFKHRSRKYIAIPASCLIRV